MRNRSIVALAFALAAGCGPTGPLIGGFRSSYDAAFAAQSGRGGKPPATATLGLDSQEAAITSDNYRAGLAPKGGQAKAEPTVIVAPPTREMAPPLAPSVPRE